MALLFFKRVEKGMKAKLQIDSLNDAKTLSEAHFQENLSIFCYFITKVP